jgi:hypothetical protein
MKIELKNLKINLTFSEETTMFKADIYANGVRIGYAENDGHGGPTNCQPYVNTRKEFKEAEDYCLSLPKIKWELGGKEYDIKSNLEHVVDDIVEKEVQKKEMEKFKKKMAKDMNKGILTGDEIRYTTIWWKGQTIESMLATPQGRMTLQVKIKALRKKGENILNTNLPDDILNP